jgi:hypothetical protein
MLRYGAQYSRFDGHPGESRPRRASWWLLCLSRGNFEGGHAGALAWSSFVHWLEGLADGGPRLHSGRCGGIPSARVPIVLEMSPQCPGWRHSDEDGRTGPEVTEEMCSAGLTSRCRPGRAPSQWLYAFRGCHHPPSRGAAWRKGGSGQYSATE